MEPSRPNSNQGRRVAICCRGSQSASIRTWSNHLYPEDGIEGLASFGHEGGICRLTVDQQDKLKAWITETLPRTTRAVGAWIAAECGIEYQTRSGLIALLHRIGMEHRKPKVVSRKLDPAKQAAFIDTPIVFFINYMAWRQVQRYSHSGSGLLRLSKGLGEGGRPCARLRVDKPRP